jgi:hypothetical protein
MIMIPARFDRVGIFLRLTDGEKPSIMRRRKEERRQKKEDKLGSFAFSDGVF